MPRSKEFIFLFTLAALLRIDGLFVSPLWYDEILSFDRARLPFMEHMQANFNAWEIVLRLFANPYMIRIPSLVCSLAAIWLAWLVMERLEYTKAQKTVSMVVLACLPGLIWMAQDARYYSGVSLIFMASLYFALTERWFGLMGVSALAFFIHPTAPAYTITGWMFTKKAPLWSILFWVIVVLLAALNVYLTSPVFGFWLQRTDAPYIVTQFALAIGAHPANIIMACVFVALAFGGAVISFRSKPLMIFAVPVAILILVSLVVEPVAFYRTLQPSLFGLALLIGSTFPKSKYSLALAVVPLALMLMQYDPGLHAGHIENATDFIRDAWTQGDCIRYEDEFSKTATSLLLQGYPECTTETNAWTISTALHDEGLFAITDGWHFPTVHFYKP